MGRGGVYVVVDGHDLIGGLFAIRPGFLVPPTIRVFQLSTCFNLPFDVLNQCPPPLVQTLEICSRLFLSYITSDCNLDRPGMSIDVHGDNALGTLPQFIVDNSNQARNARSWHPKITPYRVAVISTTLCLGTVKAVLTLQGRSIAPITLEWIMSVVLMLVWVLHHLTLFFYLSKQQQLPNLKRLRLRKPSSIILLLVLYIRLHGHYMELLVTIIHPPPFIHFRRAQVSTQS